MTNLNALMAIAALLLAPLSNAQAQVANVDTAVSTSFAQSFNQLRSSKGFGSVLYDTEMSQVAGSWLNDYASTLIKRKPVPERDDACSRLENIQTCGIMLTGGPQINSGKSLFSAWSSSLSGSDTKNFTQFGLAAKKVSGQWLYLLVLASQKFASSLDRNLFLKGMIAFRQNQLGGIQNLQYDACLDRMAQYWADYHHKHQIVNEHVANGITLESRAKKFNCSFQSLAENIDRLVSPDAERTLVRMQNSPPHRANLLLSRADRIGLACKKAPIRKEPMTAKTICVLVVAKSR